MYHALPCPRGRLVLIRDNNDDNEWGALGDRVLTTSTISYEPHINSRMVEGERTRNGSRKMEVEARDEAATGGKEIGIQKRADQEGRHRETELGRRHQRRCGPILGPMVSGSE